ncbi:unnamed protein product [Pedinophyceae sp. YPF-701]|nr:unnamed protein product [Pedinophyceae sp. YPF-701]
MSTGRDLLPDILSMLTKIHAGLQQQRQTGPDDGQPLADLLPQMDSATLGKLTAVSDAAAVPEQQTAQPDAARSVSVPDTQVDDWSRSQRGREGSETSNKAGGSQVRARAQGKRHLTVPSSSTVEDESSDEDADAPVVNNNTSAGAHGRSVERQHLAAPAPRRPADGPRGPLTSSSSGDDGALSSVPLRPPATPAPPVPDRLRRPADRDACPEKLILWPAAVPESQRQGEYFPRTVLAHVCGAPAQASSLGAEGNAKLALLAFHCTNADAALALLGCEKCPALVSAARSALATRQRTHLELALEAAVDVGSVFAPPSASKTITKLTHSVNDLRARLDRNLRASALEFTVAVPNHVPAGHSRHDPPPATDANAAAPRRAFRRCSVGIRKSELCPTADLESVVTFKKLVLDAKGPGGLNLGVGSLLRCIAKAWLSGLRRQSLLVVGGDGELRVTPAVLAGLLYEAEEMCTPLRRKVAFGANGHRTLRMRFMFDTYVRPLMRLPDGGGVLLSTQRLATWLPGAGAVPVAFRVPKEKLPHCLGVSSCVGRPPGSGSKRGRGPDAGPDSGRKLPKTVVRDYRGIVRERTAGD